MPIALQHPPNWRRPISPSCPHVKAALDGARDILAETFTEDAGLVGQLRSYVKTHAILRSRVNSGKEEAGAKFSDYFDHGERYANTPSHRALAMLRGRNEDILSLAIEVDAENTSAVKPVEQMIAQHYGIALQGEPPTPFCSTRPASPGERSYRSVSRSIS